MKRTDGNNNNKSWMGLLLLFASMATMTDAFSFPTVASPLAVGTRKISWTNRIVSSGGGARTIRNHANNNMINNGSISSRHGVGGGGATRILSLTPSATRLWYSDQEQPPEDDGASSNQRNNWFGGFFFDGKQRRARRNSPYYDSSQRAVDEYLEFLDKRYHRIHDDDDEATKQAAVLPSRSNNNNNNNDGNNKTNTNKLAGKPFSVLGWLSETPETVTQREQDDALYVLGVANLASERLLQKHGRPTQRKEKLQQQQRKGRRAPGVVIDAQATYVTAESSSSSTAGTAVLSRLRAPSIVTALASVLASTVRRVWTNLHRSLKNGPLKTVVALWTFGGGRDMATFGVSAVAVALIALRPLLAALKQS